MRIFEVSYCSTIELISTVLTQFYGISLLETMLDIDKSQMILIPLASSHILRDLYLEYEKNIATLLFVSSCLSRYDEGVTASCI